MEEEQSQWKEHHQNGKDSTTTGSGLAEYTGVQLLPSGVKILKRGNDKGEPGGNVAKLIGKINTKSLLKQKEKKDKDSISSPKNSNPMKDKNKYERVKTKKTPNVKNATLPPSPFKLPKPHPVIQQQQPTTFSRPKETSQCEISYQLQTTHPLTIQRLSAPAPRINSTTVHDSYSYSMPTHNDVATKTTAPTDLWKEIKILIHLIDGFEIEEADSPFPIGKEALDDEDKITNPLADESTHKMCEKRRNDNVAPVTHASKDNDAQFLEPPPAKIARNSPLKSPEVKREIEASPTKTVNHVVHEQPEIATPQRTSTSEEDDEEDSISIGSKEHANREEEMMNVDYASSPPSHSPVSFPLRDVSSTDSFPSHHHLDTELVDEKPPIYLCEPDGDKRIEEWTEQDVYHFIGGIEGCSQYAEEFISQEIDGQALVLLNEDHLMTNLNVKLGPALKILAKIQENKK